MTLLATDDGPIKGLATELQRQLETRRDLVADTRRTSFSVTTDEQEKPTGLELQVDLPDGAEAYRLTRHAHGQMAEHLGAPRKLYDRLLTDHPDLLAHLSNGLLSREPKTRMLRTLDGEVRAWLSNRYRPRDNWELLEQAVLPVLAQHPHAVEFKRCDLTETRMYVKIVIPGMEKRITPKVGDVMRGGVIIQNSEVGVGSLGIFPYSDVLWCTNGATHTEFGERSRHVGGRIEGDGAEAWEFFSDETLQLADAAFFAKCRDVLTATLNESIFDRIADQMRELAGIRIAGDPVKAVEVLANRHRLSEAEGSSILEALVAGADLSAWGYVNAITQTARDHDSPDRVAELEALAGGLVSDPTWALAAA